jgi:uncharacterized protein (TIGR02145 family)
LPSNEEWDILPARNLKSGVWNGIDEYGFSALLGGGRDTVGNFANVGLSGFWWSSSDKVIHAYFRMMCFAYDYVITHYAVKPHGFSVRCIKDN